MQISLGVYFNYSSTVTTFLEKVIPPMRETTTMQEDITNFLTPFLMKCGCLRMHHLCR
jgi:hypothetical protein